MRESSATARLPRVMVLLLMGMLLLLSTLMVMFAAQLYRATVNKTATHSDERVLRALVRSAVWSEDASGTVGTEHQETGDVVCIYYDEGTYVKRLYFYEDGLYESFQETADAFYPEYGEKMCGLSAFEAKMENGLLSVNLTGDDGEQVHVSVAVRTEEVP